MFIQFTYINIILKEYKTIIFIFELDFFLYIKKNKNQKLIYFYCIYIIINKYFEFFKNLFLN